MEHIPTHLRAIFAVLRAAIGPHTARPAHRAVLTYVWNYLNRTAARFERLYTLWQAGKLPKSRPTLAKPAPPAPAIAPASTPALPSATPRIPRARIWLIRIAGHQAAAGASQFQHFLTRPDLAEFLRQVPRAARLLRPICPALGIDLPPALALPPRPPRTRAPKPPAAPREPLRYGKHSPAAIRRYSPGRIPKLIFRPA